MGAMIKLDTEKLDEFLEKIARPFWEKTGNEWTFRPGGGETYLHDKVLAKAQPMLQKDALADDPIGCIDSALKAHFNLLSPFEVTRAQDFIRYLPENELMENLLRLFDDSVDLLQRLQKFIKWSKVRPFPGHEKKAGINPTVCSYLLSMHDPKRYAYCKPMAYQAFTKMVLFEENPKRSSAERIVHCGHFYAAVLRRLEERYGLQGGNLLDVHSLAYLCYHLEKNGSSKRYWTWSPGDRAEKWPEFYADSIIAIGWDDLGDLSQYSGKDELHEALAFKYGKENPYNDALCCYEFMKIMKEGDTVFAKKGRTQILGVGIVMSDYQYDASREIYRNIRKVKWIKRGTWNSSENQVAAKTLTDITPYPEFVEFLKNLLEQTNAQPSDGANFWWLNANPKIWDFGTHPVGHRHIYTARNPKGNKRRIYGYFNEVKPGDLMLCYIASPAREIAGVCRVTQHLHDSDRGEGFEFETIEKYNTPLSWYELKSAPALKDCEPLKNNQGSLFRLTQDEFETLRAMADELNTPEPENMIYDTAKELKSLFVEDAEFHRIIHLLRYKKNMILQGPPGVGKTFIARHLAYALMGVVDKRRVVMNQFHQSYSYEDFMQGFRPNSEGKFDLRNGIFYDFCRMAQRDASNPYVFVIDEINRGNLSKIFGEMFMLVEADKRGPDYALPLTYAQSLEDTFFIPENLYIIGTMNTADRSLAMVDYALRRRFCFINLEPAFESKKFRDFLVDQGVEDSVVKKIVERMGQLNHRIAQDKKNLGRGYCLGHSYFCPSGNRQIYDNVWYENVIHTEIKPLITEYWFDDEDKVQKRIDNLLK